MLTNRVKVYWARLLPGRVLLQTVATLLQLQHICLLAECIVLPQTPLLLKYAYWLSAAARWILAKSLPLKAASQLVLCFSICHTCWYGVLISAMPAGVMPHYRPYLLMWCLNISLAVLVWCLSIGHAFKCGASLHAMPSRVVPHSQSCLLVCCLTIGHAFWRGASSSTMSVGVVSHYRPCQFGCRLTIGHAFWCGASLSTMPIGVLPHYRPCLLPGASSSTMSVGVVPHYRPCLLVCCLTIGHAF